MMLVIVSLAVLLGVAPQGVDKTALNEELWNAARAGDVARVTKALDAGADVNAGNRYKATALFFAADRGHVEVIKLLLDRGADINAVDTFYKFRPLMMAMMNDHDARRPAAARARIGRGRRRARGGGGIGRQGAGRCRTEGERPDCCRRAGAHSRQPSAGHTPRSRRRSRKPWGHSPPRRSSTCRERPCRRMPGTIATSRRAVTVTLNADALALRIANQQPMTLVATADDTFNIVEAPGVSVSFAGRAGTVERLVVSTPNGPQTFPRVADGARGRCDSRGTAGRGRARPGHRPDPGQARRALRAQALAIVSRRQRLRQWRRPGRGHRLERRERQERALEDADSRLHDRSPIVWGDKVFVVTAVSGADDKTFRTGLYGDVKPVEDLSEHTWRIYALDKASGKILWERVAFKGVPKVKRHTKSTQANSTPVTDGTHVVALFGIIGRLVAWDMNGKELWTVDIGVLDSGWFFDPTYQWGHSSSPIIHDGKVIVQADIQKDSFIAAYDVRTGKQLWKTERDEISSWGTPTIFTSPSARRDRHQRADRPRLRSGDRQRAVEARAELRGHGRHAGRGRRPGLRHRRVPAGAADLCDQAKRERRHLDAEGPDVERGHRLEQHRRHLYPDAALLRRASSTPAATTACSPPTTRRAATASIAPASAAAARSPRRRSPPTASSTSRTRTATSSSRAPAGSTRSWRRTR